MRKEHYHHHYFKIRHLYRSKASSCTFISDLSSTNSRCSFDRHINILVGNDVVLVKEGAPVILSSNTVGYQ